MTGNTLTAKLQREAISPEPPRVTWPSSVASPPKVGAVDRINAGAGQQRSECLRPTLPASRERRILESEGSVRDFELAIRRPDGRIRTSGLN